MENSTWYRMCSILGVSFPIVGVDHVCLIAGFAPHPIGEQSQITWCIGHTHQAQPLDILPKPAALTRDNVGTCEVHIALVTNT